VAGSPMLLYRFDTVSSYISVPASSLGANNYRAVLPGGPCGSTAQFYFTAMGDGGATATLPQSAPTAVFSSPIASVMTTTALSADFSGGAFPAGWSATGLWHVGGTCTVSGGTCNAGSQWAYYGQDAGCNYNTGTANQGILTAPPVVIPPAPPGGTVALTFCYSLQTENSAGHDTAQVLVNGNVVDTVPDSATAWNTRSVNMAPFAGQTVTLAFKFNTVDAVFNNFRGWQLDNVVVSGQSIGCSSACYANCDGSTTPPVLNVNDFLCFQNRFASGDSYANCDGSTTPPVLNVNDFVCFQTRFAAGCP